MQHHSFLKQFSPIIVLIVVTQTWLLKIFKESEYESKFCFTARDQSCIGHYGLGALIYSDPHANYRTTGSASGQEQAKANQPLRTFLLCH